MMRAISTLLGALTLVGGGIGIIPEGIVGVFGDLFATGDISYLGKGIGNIIGVCLIFFVSYLLFTGDEFYRRHPRLFTAFGWIYVAGGLGLIISVYAIEAFQKSTLGAGFYHKSFCGRL